MHANSANANNELESEKLNSVDLRSPRLTFNLPN